MAMMKMVYAIDIRDLLPMIRVPTLVISRRDASRIRPEAGRYLADHIPDARFAEVPGVDSFMWAGDQELIVDEIEEFLTGVRPQPLPDRVLRPSSSPTSSPPPSGPPRSATVAGATCSMRTTRPCAATSSGPGVAW